MTVAKLVGTFIGTTVASLRKRVEKIEKLRVATHESAAKALADRATAIEEIRNDILEITSLRARLRE